MAQTKKYNPKMNFGKNKAKKGLLLYFFLTPLFLSVIFALMQRDIPTFGLNLIAFIIFYGSAKLNTWGLANEFKYHQEKLTKAPTKPYKTISAILLAIGTFFSASIAGTETVFLGIFLASIAGVGYVLYYGLDPRTDKLENIGDVSAELVLKTLSDAREKLSGIEAHISKDFRDLELKEKLSLAVEKSEHIIQTIQDDPKDIRVARKFLLVYLDGLEKVTDSYMAMDESDIKGETKERLHQLLDDVEIRFDKELTRLKKNNQFDLDVNIDVLHQQIKH
jgi:5-bromo-4-chloroindolyl phosphate hydrolysis protein